MYLKIFRDMLTIQINKFFNIFNEIKKQISYIINDNDIKIDPNELIKTKEYLNNQLQSNFQSYSSQVDKINKYLDSGSKVLDICCGGGLFFKTTSKNRISSIWC